MSDLDKLRAEAEAIKEWSMRSCWNCNHAHEYLRNSETPFHCWDCGHAFYKGVQLSEEEHDEEDGEAVCILEELRAENKLHRERLAGVSDRGGLLAVIKSLTKDVDRLEAENKRLRDENAYWNGGSGQRYAEVISLQNENKRLREALEIYAEAGNWIPSDFGSDRRDLFCHGYNGFELAQNTLKGEE